MRRIALLPPLLLFLALTLAATAPGAQARATVCHVPDVGGLSAQAARAEIKAFGCTGTIFRTINCVPDTGKFLPLIGKVSEQSPAPGPHAFPAKKKIEITVDVVGAGSQCTKLKPPKQPVTGYAALDGNYTATFTVQQSGNPLAKPGQKLTGITFTVKGGVLGGGLSGTISTTGHPDAGGLGMTVYDANVTATMLGVTCTGVVSFWIYDDAGQAADEAPITCGSGQNQILGVLTATNG